MRETLKRAVAKGLSFAGSFPTEKADPAAVRALLRSLHPHTTKRPLVRFGPNSDGGYLVPDDLDGIVACFSPGVDQISGFEKQCADRGMRVFLADGSVDRPAESHELFQFIKKNLGAATNDNSMTLDAWVEMSLDDSCSDLLLQIDIEGGEYEVLLATSDELMGRFRVIVAEFHHLDKLFGQPFFGLASSTFNKILQTHACVHIHPNNCCGIMKLNGLQVPRIAEFTFIRKDRAGNDAYATTFPHALDRDCTANPHMRLPECFYRAEL